MYPCSYLLKVVLGELVCNAQQLAAGVCVCEGPDAQTVGGIQLSLEELAAGLLDLSQLEKAGRREQRLDISLLYCHLGAWRSGHQRAPIREAIEQRFVEQCISHLGCGTLQLSPQASPHTDRDSEDDLLQSVAPRYLHF